MSEVAAYPSKEALMAELIERAKRAAPTICQAGSSLVWGEGSLDASLVLVGEAPGEREEKLGRPFVGPAGKLLDRELAAAGLPRSSLWITNAVKCRPTKQISGKLANRAPTSKEVRAWTGFLTEELEIISPRVVICTGALAANALIHKSFALTRERGQWFDGPLGTRAIATFHPAYILRQLSQGWEASIELFRSDLSRAAESLDS